MKPSIAALFFFCTVGFSNSELEPKLIVKTPEKTIALSRSQLLALPGVQTITVASDPSYDGKTMMYTAIPVGAIFKNIKIPQESSLHFFCEDGFSAPISKEKLLNTQKNQSQAFIAIETKDAKWPPVHFKKGERSAGPFHLVWLNPELSKIGKKEWLFQVSRFEVKKSVAELYPRIYPDLKSKNNSSVQRGFHLFVKNCFTCHTLNLEGTSQIGPDLNVPMSPTQYMTPTAIRMLIRNPQSLRNWPKARMPGFSSKELSDKDITDILSYLRHMSKK